MIEPSEAAFWDACGGAGEIRLRIAFGDQLDRIHIFRSPYVVIGRSSDSDLVLRDSEVSSQHAYLQMVAGRLWCLDLNSRRGLAFGDQKRSVTWLDRGEIIRIGKYSISVVEQAVPQTAPESADALMSSRATASDALPTATLEFLNSAALKGESKLLSLRLNRMITLVGRSSLCKLRLSGTNASRFHCALVRTHQGIWVVELRRHGAIQLNHKPIRWVRLRDGDHLAINQYEIRVRVQGGPSDPAVAFTSLPRKETAVPVTLDDPGSRILEAAEASLAQEALQQDALTNDVLREDMLAALPSRDCSEGRSLSRSTRTHLVRSSPSSSSAATIAPEASPLSIALFKQFSLMQQEMFDQFQQTVVVILQALGNQHREKMELLHQELDSLRALTKELSELRVEIASHERAGHEGSGRSRAALGAGEVVDPSRTNSAQHQRTSSWVANGNSNGSAVANGSGSPSAIPGKPPAPPTPALQPAPASDDSATRPDDPEVHAWLCERFHSLEKERQSSWQRILGMIVGSTGGTIP